MVWSQRALTRSLVYNLLQCIVNGAAGGKDYKKTIYFILSITIYVSTLYLCPIHARNMIKLKDENTLALTVLSFHSF